VAAPIWLGIADFLFACYIASANHAANFVNSRLVPHSCNNLRICISILPKDIQNAT
jgi:hypothetical protein